jgi:hypothetical protein
MRTEHCGPLAINAKQQSRLAAGANKVRHTDIDRAEYVRPTQRIVDVFLHSR